MAWVKCKERASGVREKVTTSVKCDVPVVKQRTNARKMSGGFAMLITSALITGGCASDNIARNGSDAANQAQLCRSDDLQCLGDRGTVAASIYCKGPIERLATHPVQWTAGTSETKFSHFRWTEEPGGPITFIGDRAEFRNDSGVYTPVIYQCDLGADDETVLAVRATAGRLPP